MVECILFATLLGIVSCIHYFGTPIALLVLSTVVVGYLLFLSLGLRAFISNELREAPGWRSLILQYLSAHIAPIIARSDAYAWQVAQTDTLARGVRGDAAFRELLNNLNNNAEPSLDLAQGISDYLQKRTRARTIAVKLEVEGEVFSAFGGEVGDRLRRVLGNLAARGESAASELLVAHGITSYLNKVGGVQGAHIEVFLGFGAGIAASRLESQILSEVATLIPDEILYRSRLRKIAEQPMKEPPGLMAQFSHDLRSPLNNVKAILSLLKLESLRQESTQLIEVALANCNGVDSVLEDVLDLTKLRAGKLSPRREIVDVVGVTKDVIEGFKVAAQMKGLELHLEAPQEQLMIPSDRNQLRRVVTNLVSNALKYTKCGRVSVELSRMGSQELLLLIKDTGVGMTSAQLDRLFIPFTRFCADESYGAGLGLSISKVLVERNGGVLKVNSEVGMGTEIRLTFPLVGEVPAPFPKYQENALPTFDGAKILVVDDDVDCVSSLAKLLRRDGAEVFEATTISDALSILNYEDIDLVFSDSKMPGGGAMRILDFLAVKGARPVPLFVISGEEEGRPGQDFVAQGAVAAFIKPYRYEEVRETALKAIEQAPRRRAA